MTSRCRRLAGLLAPAALLVSVLAAAPAEAAPAPSDNARVAAQCRRTLPAYPVLRPGDRGAAVRTLQCSLNDVGVGPVVVDGFYGRQTKRAVDEIVSGFEGMPEHPYRINNGMWTLLFGAQLPNRELAAGDHGHAVVVLQRALRAAGGTLAVDGDFGPQTTSVVKQYQRAQHIKPTGVVGENTRFMLAMGGVIGQLS